MRTGDMLYFSIDNLRRRKGRTFLTIVGVVVGVCSIILMFSFGIAANENTNKMLENWGDLRTITVNNYSQQANNLVLDNEAIIYFKQIPGVITASPMQNLSINGYIAPSKNEKYHMEAGAIIGMVPDSIAEFGYELIDGDFDLDQNLGNDVIPILVSEVTAFNFFNSRKNWSSPTYMISPEYDENGVLTNSENAFFDIRKVELLLKTVVGTNSAAKENTRTYRLKIVGILKFGGANSEQQVLSGIVMSLANLEKIEKKFKAENYSGAIMPSGSGNISEGYDNVYIKVDEIKNVSRIEKIIQDIGYGTYSMSQIREEMQGQVLRSQMMLGGIAAISLFVAALNIANTMTMSIIERTKEIGVMKVLGSSLKDIRTMFLIEAGLIGFIGGLIGAILSFILSLIINYAGAALLMLGIEIDIDIGSFLGLWEMGEIGSQLSIIPWWLMLFAILFATFVGVISGIKPSENAMKISPLEAIRHE